MIRTNTLVVQGGAEVGRERGGVQDGGGGELGIGQGGGVGELGGGQGGGAQEPRGRGRAGRARGS